MSQAVTRYLNIPPLSYAAWRDRLLEGSEESVRFAREQMPLLSGLTMVCLLGYYFVWHALYPNDFESLGVRCVGAIACLPTLFLRRIPGHLRKWLPLYWPLGLTYVLPFIFGYLLAQNAAHAAELGDTNIIWPLQNVVALVLFILVVNDGLLATVLWSIATLAIIATVFAVNSNPNVAELQRVYFEPMPLYGFILVAGSIAMRNKKIIELEKLRAIADVTNNMAHELRTPFLGIKALAQGIGLHLPNLLRAYQLAIDNHLTIEPIRQRHLRRLKFGLREIELETNHSNSIIDRLLINATERPVEEHAFESFSARRCVLDAIHRYPFAGRYERDLITIDLDQDFIISAPPVLMVHVLFNLLKNSLYYVQKAGKGGVTIQLVAAGESVRKIVVHDTGTGIPPQIIRRIFDRFFTTTESGHGAGIGLSFCKMVMEGLGGSIVCTSKFGHFTDFVLTFPQDHA
jgi:two-component system, CAI-1 autoinducer sensor kinase/phosphatase CqsS